MFERLSKLLSAGKGLLQLAANGYSLGKQAPRDETCEAGIEQCSICQASTFLGRPIQAGHAEVSTLISFHTQVLWNRFEHFKGDSSCVSIPPVCTSEWGNHQELFSKEMNRGYAI